MDGMVRQGLISVAAPAAIAFIAYLVVAPRAAGATTRGDASPPGGARGPARGADAATMSGSWLAPALFAIVSLGVHSAFFWPPALRPAQSSDWFPYIALSAGVLGLLAASSTPNAALRTLLRLALFAGVGYACSRSKIANGAWGARDAAWWIGGFALVGVLTLFGVERTTRRHTGLAGAGVPLVMCAGAAGLLLAAMASLNLAQEAAPMAAALGGVCGAALIRRDISLARGGAHVPVFITCAAMFQGLLYGGIDSLPRWLPWLCAGAVVLSPWTAALASAGPLGRLSGWKQALARIVLALTPIAAALIVFGVLKMNMPKVSDPWG